MNLTQPSAGTKPWNLDNLFSNFNDIGTEVENGRGVQANLAARFAYIESTFATQSWTISEIESRITMGGAPGDVAITDIGVGTLSDGEILGRVGSSLAGVAISDIADVRSVLQNLGGF